MIAQKYDGSVRRKPGRPVTKKELAALVVRMAQENRDWGYRRIQGALSNLGYECARSTITDILRRHGIEPAVGDQNAGKLSNQQFRDVPKKLSNIRVMVTFLFGLLAYARAFLMTRHSLAVETATLRQQLAVYKRKQLRPKLNQFDRLFWIIVRRVWNNWSEALVIVKPDTIVSWHRAGYRLFWRWRSRPHRVGRPKVSEEVRRLIRRMKSENRSWGAPRIHGELLLLGFEISEPTVSRYLQRLKRIPDQSKASQWHAFLNNHREVIAAFDFFTVPNLYFRTFYCFFVIEHSGRRVLHFNVTFHPTSDWIVQQLREAFPLPCPYRYVLFDHDSKVGSEVLQFLNSSALKPMRRSVRSPRQNGVAERWVGSVRHELLDHVIPLNEFHLRRIGREYLAYYHQDRTHIGLNKNTPAGRAVETRSSLRCQIVSTSRRGGLHHRYRWSDAA